MILVNRRNRPPCAVRIPAALAIDNSAIYVKSRDQLRQNKELVATYEDHQLRIGWIAVQIGNFVHSGYAEDDPC